MDNFALTQLAAQPLENIGIVLGQQMAAARRLHRWKQAELAQHLGMGLRTLRRLESGQDVAMSVWLAVARELGHLPDLLHALTREHATTLDEFDAIANGTYRGKLRVRRGTHTHPPERRF